MQDREYLQHGRDWIILLGFTKQGVCAKGLGQACMWNEEQEVKGLGNYVCLYQQEGFKINLALIGKLNNPR